LLVGHAGEPEEIAEAYLYLMRQAYGTGQVTVVDGGGALVWATVSRPHETARGPASITCLDRNGNGGGHPAVSAVSDTRRWTAGAYQVNTVENITPCALPSIEAPFTAPAAFVVGALVLKLKPPWWRLSYMYSATSWTPGASL
jgi:hypothetical protein